MDFSSSDEEIFVVALFLAEEEKEKKKERFMWVNPINAKRETLGEFRHLYPLLLENEINFFQYFRMGIDKFNELLRIIGPNITLQNTTFRRCIPTEERLAVCLRFLATGDSFRTIGFSYRLGESTVRKIVFHVCAVIWEKLAPIVMPELKRDDWVRIEKQFSEKWDFPNCLGAIDAKHVLTDKPPNSDTLSYHYRNCFSTILLSVIDADSKFITVDVGASGKISDGGGAFSHSKFGKQLLDGKLDIPEEKVLPRSSITVPHVFVGDEAFPLNNNLMRPYPGPQLSHNMKGKIFNYRLSTARRTVDECFEILTKKFCIYHRRLQIAADNMNKIVLATCCLHNFVWDDVYSHNDLDEDEKKQLKGIENLSSIRGRTSSKAVKIRELFEDYFDSEFSGRNKS